MLGIDVAEQDSPRPQAAVPPQGYVPRERTLEIHAHCPDRFGDLAVDEARPVVGRQQAGIACRRLIEIAAVAWADREGSLPAPAALQRTKIGVHRARHTLGLRPVIRQLVARSLKGAFCLPILAVVEKGACELQLPREKIGLDRQQRAVVPLGRGQIAFFARERPNGIFDQHRIMAIDLLVGGKKAADNLTNKRYIATVAIAGLASAGSEIFNPGTGRAVFGGVRFTW